MTRQEEQCRPGLAERRCGTVNEQECRTVVDEVCQVVSDTVSEPECGVVEREVCEEVVEVRMRSDKSFEKITQCR